MQGWLLQINQNFKTFGRETSQPTHPIIYSLVQRKLIQSCSKMKFVGLWNGIYIAAFSFDEMKLLPPSPSYLYLSLHLSLPPFSPSVSPLAIFFSTQTYLVLFPNDFNNEDVINMSTFTNEITPGLIVTKYGKNAGR